MPLTDFMLHCKDKQDLVPLVREIEARLTALEHVVLPTWTTQDGRVLLLRDMTDSHLANAIAYCEARPVFVDIGDNEGFDLTEDHPALEQLVREQTRRDK